MFEHTDALRALDSSQPLERKLDQALGLGPGDQDLRRDVQRQSVELAPTRDVSDRFSGPAPREPTPGRDRTGGTDGLFGTGHQVATLALQKNAKQQLGFGAGQSGVADQAADRASGVESVHAAAGQRSSARAASCSAWCSASSAWVSWERSPSMMSAIL